MIKQQKQTRNHDGRYVTSHHYRTAGVRRRVINTSCRRDPFLEILIQ